LDDSLSAVAFIMVGVGVVVLGGRYGIVLLVLSTVVVRSGCGGQARHYFCKIWREKILLS
jgi:hypothetical protein